MIGYEEALRKILDSVTGTEKTVVPLMESDGMILSEDIYVETDLPPFHNSAMDGYAVVADSLKGASRNAPAVLTFAGDLATGGDSDLFVEKGYAARIGTGGRVPAGADTVVMVEDTNFVDGRVHVYREYPVGRNIRKMGEDYRRGDMALRAGTRIRPSEICFLGANGISSVPVYGRPKVAVLSTGSELLPPGVPLLGSKIHDSNGPMIMSLAKKYGALPEYLGIAEDNGEKLTALFKSKIPEYDAFITCGGISKGYHDHVKDSLNEAGAEMRFWTTAIRPGKPFGFGTMGRSHIFALPGNPVSSFVTFEIYCQPALKKMMGALPPFRNYIEATLNENISKKVGFTFFLRGNLTGTCPDYHFSPFKKQGSGMISSLVENGAIMVAPEKAGIIEAGEKVKVFTI